MGIAVCVLGPAFLVVRLERRPLSFSMWFWCILQLQAQELLAKICFVPNHPLAVSAALEIKSGSTCVLSSPDLKS